MKTEYVQGSAAPTVSVIIATACQRNRAESLWRAIDSVLMQRGVDLELLVVANGEGIDRELYQSLEKDRRVKAHSLEQPSYPAAVRYGCSLVTSEYFSFLDDDDMYLEDALKLRVSAISTDPRIDFVVTNGYRNVDGKDSVFLEDTHQLEVDPMHALLQRNWLASCGGLYKASTVTLDYFSTDTKGYEWTFLAFQLVRELSMKFVNIPTFRVNDTPESLSKTTKWLPNEITTIDRMIALNPPSSLLPVLARLRGAALHSLADLHWRSGEYNLAWKNHLDSLRYPQGWKHLAFTRKLLFCWFVRKFGLEKE